MSKKKEYLGKFKKLYDACRKYPEIQLSAKGKGNIGTPSKEIPVKDGFIDKFCK